MLTSAMSTPAVPARQKRFKAGRMLTCAIIAVTTASSLLIPGVAAASTPQLTARTVSAGATVKTDHGTVVGINAAQGRKFLGIPYAAKPGRWQDPQPRAPWKTLATKTQHAPCPQPPFAITDDTTQYVNEDCLFLNVYTPPGPISDLPVMFFIPGGGAANGNAAPYDGSTLARKGHMIVVTANTRVGALGFLALPALGPDAGNYGVKDTVAALRWVRHNIRAFGGDTTRVTYAGFSSSTLIGCDLLASPKAAGLFSRIIQISAPCGFGAVALTKATTNGNDFAADAGCATATNVLACLRKLPVSTILAAQTQRFSARAVSGTPFLPVAPLDAIASGKFNKVPVLITGALDETRILPADHPQFPGLWRQRTADNRHTQRTRAQRRRAGTARPDYFQDRRHAPAQSEPATQPVQHERRRGPDRAHQENAAAGRAGRHRSVERLRTRVRRHPGVDRQGLLRLHLRLPGAGRHRQPGQISAHLPGRIRRP